MKRTTIYEAPRVAPAPGETVVTSTCGHNCGGRCVVNAHVRDGRIVKISTDPRRWTPEMPPLHACVRGFGQLERVNHPDRLMHPLRRTGPRGSGQFQRVSWDDALDEVAREMRRIRDTYGPAAILDCSRTGSLSTLHGRGVSQRFINMFGGCTELWSNLSAEAEIFAVKQTYGAKAEYKSRSRAHRLRQLAADRDVGLEPGRRHLWDGDHAVDRRADGRVPQRLRHLHRAGAAPGDRRLQRQDRGRVAARADRRRDRRLRHVPRARPGAPARSRRRGRLRA